MSRLTTPVAVGAAALGGAMDVRVAEVQGPAAILFVAGYVLGAAQPDGAWRRAIVLGLAVPLAHVVAGITGRTLPYRVDHFAVTFLAFLPALVGTYLGAASRRLLRPPRDGVERP